MRRAPILTVAITGMNAVPENPGAGLAVARCLREALGERVRLVGLGYDALDPGLHRPQYCDSAYLLSYPGSGADTLFSRLAEIHAEEAIDVLIPCLDAELPLLVKLAPDLAGLGMRCFLPTTAQLERRGKDRLPDLAREAEVSCPETHSVTSVDFFRDCEKNGWRYPMVVKGVFYDARVVRDRDAAERAFRAIAAEWGLPVLVQRQVSGEECNLTGIGDGDGGLLGEVMMKKRATTQRGKAWAGISIHDEELAGIARRLVGALKWKGPIEIEVMRDGQGEYQLIEINPRFPAWIYLSQGVGRNLPALLLAMATGAPPPPLAAPRAGVLFIRYAEETLVPLSQFESLMVGGQSLPENEKS